ncbi:MAG: carbohydrate ABC transporter permease [Eubacteriales bacterium]|nr:carbohydrate ABC transporter permease [Eubacteriales bacterium]
MTTTISATRKEKTWTKRAGTLVLGAILAFLAVAAFFPFVYMLLLSFTESESLRFSLSDVSLNFVNYSRVFKLTNFLNAMKNSMIVAVGGCFLNCLFCSMAAYSLEKKRFFGSGFLFFLYLATQAVPGQVTLIPVFTTMTKLHMMNTYPALILPIINGFGVFLMKQFMSSVPDELLESAKMDGAGEIRLFVNMVVPLIKPVLVSLTVFTFISTWNDFLWPLVICTDDDMQTLTVALSLLKGKFTTNYGLVMAGSVLTFLFPFTLYLFLQKQFVEGIALSGIKG